jgi:hypothetical protein
MQRAVRRLCKSLGECQFAMNCTFCNHCIKSLCSFHFSEPLDWRRSQETEVRSTDDFKSSRSGCKLQMFTEEENAVSLFTVGSVSDQSHTNLYL